VSSAGWYTLLVLAVAVERLIELRLSNRHAAWAFAHGGVETGRRHYPPMVLLHTGLLIACVGEVWLADRPFLPWLGWPMLAVVLLAQALRWWCKRAKLSRLEPFRNLAQSIQKHWNGVVAFLKTRLTNGAIEAINGLLQLAKRLARGFRSLRYFRIMAYLKAAGLHLDLPSLKPSPVTHSE